VLKDLDFERLKMRVLLPRNVRMLLLMQITADAKFLQENNIMDYSLLLGVHQKSLQMRNSHTLSSLISPGSASVSGAERASFPALPTFLKRKSAGIKPSPAKNNFFNSLQGFSVSLDHGGLKSLEGNDVYFMVNFLFCTHALRTRVTVVVPFSRA